MAKKAGGGKSIGPMPWIVGGAVAATALIIGLVAWMLSSSNGTPSVDVAQTTASGSSGIPTEATSSSNPAQTYESILSSDSSQHQAALNDFVQLGGKFGDRLEQASTGGVDPSLAQSLQAIGQDFRRLTDRMASFPPLDESGRKSLLAMMKSDPSIKVESVKKQIAQFRSSPAAKNRSVIRAYNQVSSHFGSVQSAIVELVKPLPRPKGFTGETELMMLESHRRLLSMAFAVQSDADLQRLGASFNEEAVRLTKQRDLREFFLRQDPVFQKDSTYQVKYAWMESALNRRMADLQSTFQAAPLKDSVAAFEAAKASIFTVIEDHERGELEKAKQREAEIQKRRDNMPEAAKKRRQEFLDKMQKQDLQLFEESIADERKQHPASEFVLIRLNRPLPFFKKFEWEDRLEEVLKCKDVTSHELSDEKNAAAITLAYNGPIEEVADAIWFGKVISSDAETRKLEVRMNADVEE